MDTEKLEKVYIPHLVNQFQEGSPVLFTGAGFSVAAKNAFGGSIPSYRELCQVLWGICYPGEDFDDTTNLQDLYEDALLRHRQTIAERLPPMFTVDTDSLPDWYAMLFGLPWFKAYTLNVDDIELAVQRKHSLPRRIISISAAIQQGAHLFTDTGEHLAVIHLNGSVGDLPDNVTFSTTQYAERISRPDPWYMQLAADLISRPFVFIGTRLDEPPLWQHIELRRTRGGRGLRELRPRSYLVTPTLSKPRQALLAEFNVVWLPMSAEEFALNVVKRFGPHVNGGFTALQVRRRAKSSGSTRLLEVGDLAQSPLAQTDYLLGREPIWADIQAGRAIERESDGSVWAAVENGIRRSSTKGVIVLTGTAGSGKSTALMRACLRSSAEATRIAWIDRNSDVSPRDIIKAMRSEGSPPVLAISDADMFGAELSPMLRDIVLSDNYPLVLVEVRSGKVDKAVNRAQLDDVRVDEVSMPPLTDSDIDSLIEVLDKENRLGALKGKSRKEQIRAFQQQAGRQLLVAMYQATTNQRFEEKGGVRFVVEGQNGSRS